MASGAGFLDKEERGIAMRHKTWSVIWFVGSLLAGVFAAPAWAGQNAAPPSLAEQLKAQYKLVKMGSDAGGRTVVDPGIVVVIQKGGILGVPQKNMAICPSTYQDGDLHGPNGLCAAMVKQVSSYFQNGAKVYPSKIDVNLKSEKISFGIVACDSCNGTNPPTYFKGEVNFQFSKGYLEKADVSQIEDGIGQVLAIDSGTEAQQSQPAQGGGDQAQAPAQTQAANPTPQAEPQTIQAGQTPDQVQAALGKPEKIVDLGSKKIWVYKDLKVTFVNGKVSDVQ